jgi:hypothetical protein
MLRAERVVIRNAVESIEHIILGLGMANIIIKQH